MNTLRRTFPVLLSFLLTFSSFPMAARPSLEVKTRSGRLSPGQMVFTDRCKALEAPYAIVRSPDKAEAAFASWAALRAAVRQAACGAELTAV